MSLPIDKPCIFCGGEYTKVHLAKGYEDYEISTLVIGKMGETGIRMAKSVVYQCATCGNVQAFLEREPVV